MERAVRLSIAGRHLRRKILKGAKPADLPVRSRLHSGWLSSQSAGALGLRFHHRSSPAPTRSSNSGPTRLHAAPGRRDDGDAPPSRAAEGDAVIGYLSSGSPPGCTVSGRVPPGTERKTLCRGTNLAIEYRWARAAMTNCPHWAADLVGRQGRRDRDGGTPSVLAAKGAT